MSSEFMMGAKGVRELVDDAIYDGDFELALSTVEYAIKQNRWLRMAYLSYYRKGPRLSLHEVGNLDRDNIEYFRLICNLRKISGWTDQGLYDLEMLAKSTV